MAGFFVYAECQECFPARRVGPGCPQPAAVSHTSVGAVGTQHPTRLVPVRNQLFAIPLVGPLSSANDRLSLPLGRSCQPDIILYPPDMAAPHAFHFATELQVTADLAIVKDTKAINDRERFADAAEDLVRL